MRSARIPAALVLGLLTAGCGGGSHAVDLTAPAPTATAGSDLGLASTTPLPSDLPVVAAPSPGSPPGPTTGGASTGTSTPAAATGSGLALPPTGEATYELSGQSSLGALPSTLRFRVAEAAGGQTWTFDASNPDSSGLIEVLSVSQGPDGIYLSDYELKVNGGLWHVDLHLAPRAPVPLVPTWPHGGWEFDMPSANGCENAHTVGTVLPDAEPSAGGGGSRHVKLVTTATATGKANCPPIQATRTQELWLPAAGGRPSRIDTDVTGSFGAASAGMQYRAVPNTAT